MFVAGFIGSPAMNFVDVTITDKLTLKNHQFEIETPAKIKGYNKEKRPGGQGSRCGYKA